VDEWHPPSLQRKVNQGKGNRKDPGMVQSGNLKARLGQAAVPRQIFGFEQPPKNDEEGG
jgi:hypothetical protein